MEPSLPEHRLVTAEAGQLKCACGWTPDLGTSSWREYDRHLLEMERKK